ncbi:patatin-like phospholipase family protein [Undibacterium sp. CY21W]|uniref:patatin-like phospholipase family protein n=1 Tax=Undibacterium sp. CY21W TaxID=2762293 RepID=UPI00164AA524|nr:patatin-like phospholipase family protein [Undibacterium sp. CY21W]MBC3926747.1 patatin-like phospholipase family protein [Undibacterium sp. CY21W]
MTNTKHNDQIALALSGGGVRAMAFHSGVLRFLAEQEKLEYVSKISTVSGGSLLVGLIFSRSSMVWPGSQAYLNDVWPSIRDTLTTTNLERAALSLLLFCPSNWRYTLSRANVLAQALESAWGISGALSGLPNEPEWSINGTTAETGKRFRFKREDLGDYELGYARAHDYPLASAMAISAAFPLGIGPLSIKVKDHDWFKRPAWNSPADALERTILPYERIHIYDGGVYDNLGLEPFFDAGKLVRKGDYSVIASDAGLPLARRFDLGPLSPFRLGRLMDIVTDQTRSLRIRTFVQYLIQGGPGAYLQIGSIGERVLKQSSRTITLAPDFRIDATAAERARSYPTRLHSVSLDAFDLLEQHGYETAQANQLAFPYL